MTEYDPKDKFLMVYGIGDGGGGPSMTMVERCKREENISFVPKVKMGNAHEFFDSIDKDPLPTFKGEMYLEKHILLSQTIRTLIERWRVDSLPLKLFLQLLEKI